MADFEVLLDADPLQPPFGPQHDPVIALKVDPTSGNPFIMPMSYQCGKEMAELMLRTLLKVAPELFTEYAKR
jgi:hypothetical protein